MNVINIYYEYVIEMQKEIFAICFPVFSHCRTGNCCLTKQGIANHNNNNKTSLSIFNSRDIYYTFENVLYAAHPPKNKPYKKFDFN